jgi:hypothetical protein
MAALPRNGRRQAPAAAGAGVRRGAALGGPGGAAAAPVRPLRPASRLGAGEPEPEVQEGRELVGWIAWVQGQVEPFLVADDDGAVRVPADAGRVPQGASGRSSVW